MKRVELLLNQVLHLFELRRIPSKNKDIYLTFDDAPEPGITEFVLAELRRINGKATFFCRGDNAEKYSELLNSIIEEGHSIGNHTYSHINSFYTPTKEYIADVNRADAILHSHLFRPPWGSVKLMTFLKLSKRFRIIYWNRASGDTYLDRFNLNQSLKYLIEKTQKGDIVLFHCCHRHEKETRQLLPEYLTWLNSKGYLLKPL